MARRIRKISGLKVAKVNKPNTKGARVMSPISIKLKERLAEVQGKGTIIKVNSDGRQVLSSGFGKSMREMYLEEQGYDID